MCPVRKSSSCTEESPYKVYTLFIINKANLNGVRQIQATKTYSHTGINKQDETIHVYLIELLCK